MLPKIAYPIEKSKNRRYLALLGSLKKSFGPGALPSLASRRGGMWRLFLMIFH